jgi:Flp pilus assembly protein TadG
MYAAEPGRRHRLLKRFRKSSRGFAAAEAAILALILCGICIVVGGILRKGGLTAAKALNEELAGK